LVKVGNIFRWIYGHLTGRPTNFNWLIEGNLAGCGIPTSFREIKWLYNKQGIKSLVTIAEKALPSDWFLAFPIENFFLNTKDYGAPPVAELEKVVNYIRECIDHQKPVAVHCCSGKGRTGTILAAYLIQAGNPTNAHEAIEKVSRVRGESIQSGEQENVLHEYEEFIVKRE
jgi:atypical dual specificity phosphatase